MRTAPELPELDVRDVVEVELATTLLDHVCDEIERLEQELADVEAATLDAQRRASAFVDDPDGAESIAFVGRFIDEMLLSARTEIRRSIEEPGLQAAADRLLEARRGARELLRSARGDVGATVVAEARVGSDVVEADAPIATAADEAVDADAPTDAEAVAAEAAAFDAFWREQHDAAEARGNVFAPMEVLLPMAVMLLLLVLVLLFI